MPRSVEDVAGEQDDDFSGLQYCGAGNQHRVEYLAQIGNRARHRAGSVVAHSLADTLANIPSSGDAIRARTTPSGTGLHMSPAGMSGSVEAVAAVTGGADSATALRKRWQRPGID